MEFRKNIIATGKEMNDAFDKGFSTNKVRIKFVEAIELKGTEKYLADNETYTFNTLFRAAEDFKVPKKKTMTMKDFKKYLSKLDNNKNMEEKTMKLEKGDIIKTELNNKTIVLDVKDKEAILFTGTQFVLVNNIKENKKTKKFEWDSGRYTDDIDKISIQKNNNFNTMLETLEGLSAINHSDFVKGIISRGTGIKDMDILDNAYDNYRNDNTMGLIEEQFKNLIDKELFDIEEIIENEQSSYKKDDTKNINGYIATDIELKTLTNGNDEQFRVANFSIAENDDMGNVHYTKCTAYNDKIDKVKNFKKGDFVHLFGREKISYGKNDKEYVNLTILSAKMLKEKKIYKETGKTENKKKSKSMGNVKTDKKKTSVKGKLKEYKDKADKTVKKSLKKVKANER